MFEIPVGLIGTIVKLFQGKSSGDRYINHYQKFLDDCLAMSEAIKELEKPKSLKLNIGEEISEEQIKAIEEAGKASINVEKVRENFFNRIREEEFFSNNGPYWRHLRELNNTEKQSKTAYSALSDQIEKEEPQYKTIEGLDIHITEQGDLLFRAARQLTALRMEENLYMYGVLKSFHEEFLKHIKRSGELKGFNQNDKKLITKSLTELVNYFKDKIEHYEKLIGKKLP